MVGTFAAEAVPRAIEVAWLIPFFPLVAAGLLLFFGKRWKEASGPVAVTAMLASFVTAIVVFARFIDSEGAHGAENGFVHRLWSWFAGSDFEIAVQYRIDPLSLVMILVVTGVGTLITLYSVGYMRGDERVGRFFAYMSMFASSMLILVMADNFLLLYVGWELVGLCSYLLIGFWYENRAYASAAKKAFITTRVGDTSLLIGIFLIGATFGTFNFGTVLGGGELATGTATAIALLLFGGAIGKSGQIPLHVWLPDAMAGPTPVSALIHAATMVTAGVYLVARAHRFFDISPIAGDVVAWVGVATALFAGLIAIAQDDIKRVLAYSTISQLGYMFVGVGVGAYTAGVFHLVTHAFFKALLFLGAGSVMHALANRTDITTMGGLFRKIPWTATMFAAGWLAIIGFPGTAGFFSKDQILEGAYEHGAYAVWAAAVIGVAITGFYMTRLFALTFLGRARDPDAHPHESPPSMVFPLVVLAAAAIAAGAILGPTIASGRLHHFLEPVVTSAEAEAEAHAAGGLSAGQLSGIALLSGLIGAALALVMYRGRRWNWQQRRENPGVVWRALRNRLYVDEVYQFLFTSVGRLGATTLAYVVDTRWIDGVVNGAGTVATRLAAATRKLQSGLVRTYALAVLGGGVGLAAFLFMRGTR